MAAESPAPTPPPAPEAPAAAPPARLTALAVAAAVVGALAGLVYWLSRPPPSPPASNSPVQVQGEEVSLEKGAPQWKYLELATAQEEPALPPLPAPGHVDLDENRTSAVGTPLAGRVERVLVRLGDRVKAGDRLFSVRSAAWADLEREYVSARNAVEIKGRLAAKAKELVSIKAVSEKESLAADAELKDAELSLKAAEAKRAALRVAPEGDNLFWVAAARPGTVVDLDLSSGQEATPDREKPLLRVADLEEVLVIADVQEADVYDLKEGASVMVRVPAANLARPGTVTRISEVVDPRRRTVEVRIRAANADHALRPNAYVQVEFPAEAGTRRVRVPSEAVVTEGSASQVFVERSPGHLQRVRVTLGRQRDGLAEVREGLAAGSRYVSRGAILLTNQIDLAD